MKEVDEENLELFVCNIRSPHWLSGGVKHARSRVLPPKKFSGLTSGGNRRRVLPFLSPLRWLKKPTAVKLQRGAEGTRNNKLSRAARNWKGKI